MQYQTHMEQKHFCPKEDVTATSTWGLRLEEKSSKHIQIKASTTFSPRLHCSNLKQVRVSRRWPQDKGEGKAQLLRETDALCLCPQYCGHLWVLSLSPHTLLSYGRDRGPQAPCPHTCAFLHVVSLWESCSFLSCETPISNVASLVNTPCTPTLDPSHKVK